MFYSAQPDFDSIAKNLYRDRVSFYSLIGDEGFKGFKEKTVKLIDHTVSKLQELNNIRGLVMAETSELDNIVEEMLFSFLSKTNEKSKTLKEYIVEIIISSSQGNLKQAQKLNDLDTYGLVKSRIFDADKKSRSINKLLELLELKESVFVEFYKNYKTDVLDTRNDLAHAKSDVIDGVEYLIISKKGEEHPIKFNQEHCILIRKNLRNQTDILKRIKEILSSHIN